MSKTEKFKSSLEDLASSLGHDAAGHLRSIKFYLEILEEEGNPEEILPKLMAGTKRLESYLYNLKIKCLASLHASSPEPFRLVDVFYKGEKAPFLKNFREETELRGNPKLIREVLMLFSKALQPPNERRFSLEVSSISKKSSANKNSATRLSFQFHSTEGFEEAEIKSALGADVLLKIRIIAAETKGALEWKTKAESSYIVLEIS